MSVDAVSAQLVYQDHITVDYLSWIESLAGLKEIILKESNASSQTDGQGCVYRGVLNDTFLEDEANIGSLNVR